MRSEALAGRLTQDTAGALEMYAVYLGDQLGYYRAMAAGDWLTAGDLAGRTGTASRYCEEWLSHQAVREIVEVEDVRAQPRRYRLPAEHVPVLTDPDSLLNATSDALNLARFARRLPDLVTAYRAGEAPPPLPWGPDGRAEKNRPVFRHLFARQWLPAVPHIDRRLRAPGARAADIACGTGWSSIAMAQEYPQLSVDGIDLDAPAIERARANARDSGVAGRTRFEVADAAGLAAGPRYDLVTIIQALHDMAQPVATLRAARESLASGACVLVGESRVQEEFTVPGTELEQAEYGWSLLSCLPDAMEPGSAATGTVMRPATLRRYAADAGFGEVRVLPIGAPDWWFYELTV
nr:class I SAM-dependent methyltransferase [uncultured Actinoplanes sp.]